jgi:predicted ATPase
MKARFGANSPDEAAVQLQEALAVAREQSAKLWELRAALTLAEQWYTQGRREAARELLEPTYLWFSEGLNTPDLIAARTLLAQLRAGIQLDGLTRRDAAPRQRAGSP